MKHGSFNYVRTSRQRHALTTDEVALLIGQKGKAAVPQFEAGSRVPTLEVALALQVVFGLPPREMFPELFERIEDAVMRRASELHARLDGLTDRFSEAKRSLLEEMPGRSVPNDATA